MTTHPKDSSAEGQKVKPSEVKDPRHIVTPDAFTVSEKLLGLPLATPKRRAIAMSLDLLLIQQLSQMGSLLLGLSIALILFLLSKSQGRKTVGSIRSMFYKFLALLLFIYMIAFESWQFFDTKEFSLFNSNANDSSVTEVSLQNKAIETTKLPLSLQLVSAKEEIESLTIENRILKANDNSDIIDIFAAMARKFGYGFGWAGVYFTLFVYMLSGQTPGKFVCRIRIVQLDGRKLTIWNSFGRYGGYAASVVTGLSGFLQIFWDSNRQGLHDKVASTVVVQE